MDFRLMLAAFMARLVKAGQMLGDICYTAWLEAPEDQYLQKQLQARNAVPAGTEKKK